MWAFEQIAPELREKLPPRPGYLGSLAADPPPCLACRPVRAHWLAIPSMRQWLGGPPADGAGWHDGAADDDDDFAHARQAGLSEIAATFCDIRQQQIAMLDELAQVDWKRLGRRSGATSRSR